MLSSKSIKIRVPTYHRLEKNHTEEYSIVGTTTSVRDVATVDYFSCV